MRNFIFLIVGLLRLLSVSNEQTDTCKVDIAKVRAERETHFKGWIAGTKVPNIVLSKNSFLYQLRAKNIIIVFWKTDCPYCEKLLPRLEDLSTKYSKNLLKVVAICLDDHQMDWAKQNRIKSPNPSWYHKCEGKGYFGVDAARYFVFGTPSLLLLNDQYRIKGKPKNIDDLMKMIESVKQPLARLYFD